MIVKQGDEGDYFYIIEDGVVDVHKTANPEQVHGIHASRPHGRRRGGQRDGGMGGDLRREANVTG